ncbi:uncharacterized protein FIBRA_03365 [Fibroporia radiculosa]|uniref:Autophagy-related protein 14 n=1 Tax=Fibroporia radiculosa TaxID=599839 RepID=J4I9K4_9APHY|nr:uncharacterized protein FIBRA_03365 [Fibroporia radiculosa]CCM01316.1 predicted protein [Fibroporia radiculosa]
MSSTSSASLSNLRFDADGEPNSKIELGTRRRALSRASISGNPGPATASGASHLRKTSTTTSTVRTPLRQRAPSAASSSTSYTSLFFLQDPREVGASGSSRIADLLQDTSQKGLEDVLHSRLVETFITIVLPSSLSTCDDLTPKSGVSANTSRSPPVSPLPLGSNMVQNSESLSKTSGRRSTSIDGSGKPGQSGPATPSRLHSTSGTPRGIIPSMHVKSASASLPRGSMSKSKSISSPSAHRQRSPIPAPFKSIPTKTEDTFISGSTSPGTPSSPSLADINLDAGYPVPDYISPIHRPSTNPSFQFDARFGGEFTQDVDVSQSRMHVEVWGHVRRGLGWSLRKGENGKGKGKQKMQDDELELEWKVIQSWDVDLEDLIPLPETLAAHPSQLPSNTLLITLSPPGRTYYLPLPSQPDSPHPLSADIGYSSDQESEIKKLKGAGEIILPERRLSSHKFTDEPEQEEVNTGEEYSASRRRGRKKTASWQDLLRLINLQACIVDTQQSLSEIVREIDNVVTQSGAGLLRRELSEQEAWVGQLHCEAKLLRDESETVKSQLHARRERLRKRREMLALAREADESDSRLEFEQEAELVNERVRLEDLRSQIAPMRSVLLTTLSFVFPIELVSPPDLLFTILDVPLPIPLAPTDPAPPLLVPAHKDVTEEAVATALGYAAQVVQFLAAYMGKGLVYPVTCVGSRSLIRDGISAMVGPRMFPLFSKGVDTYRFEYGVFLLNKDIEMLMSDRNLRALDMRHTLPNLKNLLLTLTDNESTQLPTQRFSTASSVSISSLQSPVLTASSLPSTASEPPTDPNSEHDGLPTAASHPPIDDSESPPRSGSTTPTTASTRRSRAFLDLAPFAGFLRGRYPSSSRPSVRSVPESPEGAQALAPSASTVPSTPTVPRGQSDAADDSGENADDEDDRRTIRGRSEAPDVEETESEGKVEVSGNGHAAPEANGAAEKMVDQRDTPPLVNGVS